jgi:hypothetical protein
MAAAPRARSVRSMSLVATISGVDGEGVAFARTLVGDAPTRQVKGDPATLGDLLTNLDAQLLVIPPSRAQDLMDEAPCIVAVVPPAARRRRAVRTIGVVWDGSSAAAHARRWAVALARRTHAELRMLNTEPAGVDGDLDVIVVGCGHPDQGSTAAQVATRAPSAVIVVVPVDVDVPPQL